MMPSGSRVPGPTINSIAKNWPASGARPQRQVRFGSRKPSVPASRQTAGIPTEKYKPESHASLFPDVVEINTHISAPAPAATISNQCSFFMVATLAERVTLIA